MYFDVSTTVVQGTPDHCQFQTIVSTSTSGRVDLSRPVWCVDNWSWLSANQTQIIETQLIFITEYMLSM